MRKLNLKQIHFRPVMILCLLLLTACQGQRRLSAADGNTGEPSLRASELSPLAAGAGIDDYRLGSEDEIEVLVWKNADLSRTVLVRPDGKISLPLLGELQAAGHTPAELKDAIRDRLKEYKETPEVSIIVKGINSFSVFVMGEVVHPGRIQLRSETTLLQAITQAGGFTKFADSDRIVLLRRAGGQEIHMRLNFKEIIKGKSADKNVLLQRGDTIVVP